MLEFLIATLAGLGLVTGGVYLSWRYQTRHARSLIRMARKAEQRREEDGRE